ncbi:MAG: hypothetical protein LC803_21310 [Acidobacteria bacterium]|nr:hypothetical protein [Acidobacteriota bacterium]
MRSFTGAFMLMVGCVMQHASAQQTLKVPEGRGSPVLIDGIFSRDEWQNATTVKADDSVMLYLKQFRGHVFIGVKTATSYPAYVDMFLLTGLNELYNLHASMQIGERTLTSSLWTDGVPSWRWGNHVGWIANEAKYDSTKDRSLPDKEKVFPYEGKEFQLLRSRFTGKQWQMRVEVRGSTPDLVFPAESERRSSARWLILQL